MKSRDLYRSTAAFALVLLFAADGHAQADAKAKAKANANAINRTLVAQCPTFAGQMFGSSEMKFLQRDRPIDLTAVCACTAKGFAADKRMQEQFEADEETLKLRMNGERLSAYALGRLMSSMMSCMVPELEATLNASSPQ